MCRTLSSTQADNLLDYLNFTTFLKWAKKVFLKSRFVNNTLYCDRKIKVDLDALNLIATGNNDAFLKCTYKEERKRHMFTYIAEDGFTSKNVFTQSSFEDTLLFLTSVYELIGIAADNNLSLKNINLSSEGVLRNNNNFKFIYYPIEIKKSLSKKEFVLKSISQIKCRDVRITDFRKKIKLAKNDDAAFELLEDFVSMYSGDSNKVYFDVDLTADEVETELLTNKEQFISVDSETMLLDCDNYVNSFAPIYEETSLLNSISDDDLNKTTLLTDEQVEQFSGFKERISGTTMCFVRMINSEKMKVDKTPFQIGKDVSSDYCLKDSSVSRNHATITFESGKFYITDNKSTNGTIVEGIKLKPYVKTELGEGYIILIGNESFQTYIERG